MAAASSSGAGSSGGAGEAHDSELLQEATGRFLGYGEARGDEEPKEKAVRAAAAGRSIVSEIEGLRQAQKAQRAERRKLTLELRNARRKKQRLKKKADQLSNEDLITVLAMREESVRARAAAKEMAAAARRARGTAAAQTPAAQTPAPAEEGEEAAEEQGTACAQPEAGLPHQFPPRQLGALPARRGGGWGLHDVASRTPGKSVQRPT